MEKDNKNFYGPGLPWVIVRELTPAVIKDALEAFIIEKEDGFWFKLYSSILSFTIDDLNLIIDH